MRRLVRVFVMLFTPVLAFCAPNLARAEEPPGHFAFGDPGQLALDDVLGVRIGSLTRFDNGAGALGSPYGMTGFVGYSHEEGSSTTSAARVENDAFWLNPSFDVFVAKHFSVGAAVHVGYLRYATEQWSVVPDSKTEIFGFSIAPRLGYAIPIADGVVLWPRIQLGFEHSYQHDTYARAPTQSNDESSWFAGGDLGFVFAITRHLYVDAAPEVVFGEGNGTSTSQEIDRGLSLSFAGTLSLGVVL